MSAIDLTDQVRFYCYIAGVLENQQEDDLCCKCKAYSNAIAAVREGLAELESGHSREISGDMLKLLKQARNRLRMIKVPENAAGQKKAGNCKMPEGICFVKSSKAIMNSLKQP